MLETPDNHGRMSAKFLSEVDDILFFQQTILKYLLLLFFRKSPSHSKCIGLALFCLVDIIKGIIFY